MLRAGLLLGLFAVAGTGIVAMTETFTQEQIIATERAALQQAITAVLPPAAYNNPILEDTLRITAPALLGAGESLLAYRARQDGRPVAVILTAVAPEGYNGAIKLLVGIRYDGSLTGVRVVSHKETPGLGDKIEEEKSSWILGFSGRSLNNPTTAKWRVKRDGGIFDQFTGATITPRTIVKTIRNTLRYFKDHRDMLFAEKEKNLNAAPPH